MNSRHPIYIVSKGRWESRLTSKSLEAMGQPYFIVVEGQEYRKYCSVIDPSKVLVLPERYLDEYDTFDGLGRTKSVGPGAARNFAWEHAIQTGHEYHWVMDDNINGFYRLNHNLKLRVGDGTIFRCMEDFISRYTNITMAGPNYFMFASRKSVCPPFITNTRIYSCNLIRNDAPYRWRGRYNEDTDLSIRMMRDGNCTVQFNAFLQMKTTTQQLKGGNTKEFYEHEGTSNKSQMQVDMHPDISKLVYRFGRIHHYVDYTVFRNNKLIRKVGLDIPEGTNNYGMILQDTKGETDD